MAKALYTAGVHAWQAHTHIYTPIYGFPWTAVWSSSCGTCVGQAACAEAYDEAPISVFCAHVKVSLT